jgi:predicted transcriptional regulator
MQINFTAEQEAQLSQVASFNGAAPEEFVQQLALRFLQDQTRFREGVRRGIDAADRGDFVETSELWAELDEIPEA